MTPPTSFASTMRTLLCLLLLGASVRGDVVLGPLFTDHAVLQRDKPLPVWGRAEPGEHVVVTFAGQKVGATTGADGRWVVMLEPIPVSATPLELKVEGKNALTVSDVLLGDVWLCAGQSNMEMRVSQALNPEREITSANAPLIRHLKIEPAAEERPTDQAKGAWVVCSPETVGDFSAVGYFFAREIVPRVNVPVGLVNSSLGGTAIESWMSAANLASDPEFAVIGERWVRIAADRPVKKAVHEKALAAWTTELADAKARGLKFSKPAPVMMSLPGPNQPPSSLFNGMINPLLPCALAGVLWYQGESNWYNGSEYGSLFTTLIEGWHRHFGQGDLPFFWVQLANFKGGDPAATDFARIREGQSQALKLARTGQAVAIDVGDRNDVHPKNKQEVARRLALLARAAVYGAQLDTTGPVYLSATREGAAMRVRFIGTGTALTARSKPLQSFQVAGADRRFRPAVARIEKDTVVVSAKDVPEPVAVRYAFFNAPEANLYNGAGLPAAPFRSDDW